MDNTPSCLNMWAQEAWDLMNLSHNTLNNYKWKYNKYIKPLDLPLEMNRRQVQRLVNTLDAPNDKKVLAVLSSLLSYAVEYDVLQSNPCFKSRTKSYIKPRRDWMTFDELPDVGSYNEAVRFMATTGMRLSEAWAITEQDIEEAKATGWLTLNKSIHGTTKSGKERQVPYMGHGCKVPRSRQFSECLHPYTMHSLRYTYAHWLKTKGVHPQVAQKLLGHSTIVLTMDLYTGVLNDELEAARVLLTAS